ncbi:hypothetical protein PHSY_002018 [Pseudozyma hubeiensis SY62]|uniref:Uncharacterized protein n=1 Tax=Pseudozyma hubeiensis (strain SY62) TaxID=1305764 RepID=R9P0B0_PSEHS|nr:hypothetical protein PHSY_002018 [Pseudozyma hubeiensis SY62]GAC94447.1 hypothetical protein PHSY_002018 [Pseudozyma hubeiensis SY62]
MSEKRIVPRGSLAEAAGITPVALDQIISMINLFRPLTVDDFQFPPELNTNADLYTFYKNLIRPQPSLAVQVYMLVDTVQSVFTASFCLHVMFKRGRMRETNFVTLRRSRHGAFVVPNAVWVMLIFIAIYLIGWAGFCSYMFYVSFTDLPLINYLFYIPNPFAKQKNLANNRKQENLQTYVPMHRTQEWLKSAPSADALLSVKIAWTDLANVYRWVCASIATYLVLVVVVIAMLILYAISNHIFLLKHLLRIFPDQEFKQKQDPSILYTLQALWKIGRPSRLLGGQYSAFKRTWMVTVVGYSQTLLVLAGTITFTVPPYYLYFVPWAGGLKGLGSANQVEFVVEYVITGALITAAWIIGLAAMLTYDDVYRAVVGTSAPPSEDSSLTRVSGRLSTSVAQDGGESAVDSMEIRPLRPMLSFAPTTTDSASRDEKSEILTDNLTTADDRKNKVFIRTTTTVHIEHQDAWDLERPTESVKQDSETSQMASHSFLGRKLYSHE